MAVTTQYSTAVLAGVCPDHNIPAGIVLSRTGVFTASAAYDDGSTIQLIPMPKGAQLLSLMIAHSALGASRTIDVGIGTSVDCFFNGSDVTTAGQKTWGAAMGGAVANTAESIVHGANFLAATWPYQFTANDSIDVLILGDTFPSGGVVTGVAIYKFVGAIADEE